MSRYSGWSFIHSFITRISLWQAVDFEPSCTWRPIQHVYFRIENKTIGAVRNLSVGCGPTYCFISFYFIYHRTYYTSRLCILWRNLCIWHFGVSAVLSILQHAYLHTYGVIVFGWVQIQLSVTSSAVNIANSLPLQSVTGIKSLITDQIWFRYTVSLSLHLAAYYTGICTSHEAVWGNGGTNPLILNLSSNGCEWSASSTGRFNLWIHWLRECGVQAGLMALGKTKTSLSLPAIERRFLGRPAHSLASTPAHVSSGVGWNPMLWT